MLDGDMGGHIQTCTLHTIQLWWVTSSSEHWIVIMQVTTELCHMSRWDKCNSVTPSIAAHTFHTDGGRHWCLVNKFLTYISTNDCCLSIAVHYNHGVYRRVRMMVTGVLCCLLPMLPAQPRPSPRCGPHWPAVWPAPLTTQHHRTSH